MKNLNNCYGIFKILCLGIFAILASTFTGCDNEFPMSPPLFEDVYKFGIDDSMEEICLQTFDSSERTFTITLYNCLNEPIYNFVSFRLSELCIEYKDGKLVEHSDFINAMPTCDPFPGIEYQPLDWVTVKNIQNPGDPVTFQVTISENNTDEVRGFGIELYGEKLENKITTAVAKLDVYQLPAEQKTSDVNMKIRYRGEIFESSAEIDQDGCYHYDNPEFAQMIKKLSTDLSADKTGSHQIRARAKNTKDTALRA